LNIIFYFFYKQKGFYRIETNIFGLQNLVALFEREGGGGEKYKNIGKNHIY